MPEGCFITGTGLVTAQGIGVEANWQNLLAGRVLHDTGIVPLPRDPALPRVSQLAIEAARQALTAAGRPPLSNGRTALLIGTSKGPIEDWLDQLDGRRPPDLSLGIARVASDVAAAIGHSSGPRLTYAGACASGLNALVRARDLLTRGDCDHALVIGAEASTHPLFRANFARLGVLADPAVGCRPFDRYRRGFLLAEAAAAVWLTAQRPTDAKPVRIDAGLSLADATHLTGIDPAGRTLRHLLSRLRHPAVGMIHAHGTGTLANDAVELAAIDAVLGDSQPAIFSHKHSLGHTQGAAGMISVVVSHRMLACGIVLGNSNSPDPIGVANHCTLWNRPATIKSSCCVVTAAGFGGTSAGVRISMG